MKFKMKLYITVTDFSENEVNPNQDLELVAGTDNILDLFILDEFEAGMVISGATIYFIVKRNSSDLDANAVINKSYPSSTFPNATNGEAAITILKEWTTTLIGNYVYQILIQFSGRPLKLALEGTVCFQNNILTHPSGTTPYDEPPYAQDLEPNP
jgi:hypothetical protein